MPRNPIFLFALFLSVICLLSGCAEERGEGWRNGASQTISGTDDVASPSDQTPPVLENMTAEKAKVALLVPLSGRGQDTGEAMLNAAQLAMFDLKADQYFELMPKDTGGNAANAASEAVRDHANVILGPLFADDTKSTATIANNQGVAVLSFSTDVSAAKNNVYLMGFLPQTQVDQVLKYALAQGKNRIALIAPRDAYGDSVATEFYKFGNRYKLNTTGLVRFDPQYLPTISDIARLKSAAPQAVLIAAAAPTAAKISAQMTAQGLPPTLVKRLGTGLWDDAASAQFPELQGAWFAAVSPQLRSGFEGRYQRTYGQVPPRLASLAYDATSLAVVLAKENQPYTRTALERRNGFAGVDGIFRFNEDGLVERALGIMEFRNGRAVLIEIPPNNFSQP